ncbi:hypothetical protein NGUA37_04092 [Salmonella enterica]|nr:hypothetical protein NGUA37_04092 [Salmonella enterica]
MAGRGGTRHSHMAHRTPPAPDKPPQRGTRGAGSAPARRTQRPPQPRQRVEADARLEGRPHEAQPLQGGVIEQAVAAWCARHRAQQSAQQVVAHDMHAHPGIKSQPGHRVGVH